ncbi:nuclease [Deinococcus humi]|nr:nuclease [Deinococcus humi]
MPMTLSTAPKRLLLAGLLALAACGQAPQSAAPATTTSLGTQSLRAADTGPLTRIGAVQGETPSGDAPSPLLGQRVTVEGVVTGLRTSYVSATRSAEVDGFFMQEHKRDINRNGLASDGIFVFCGSACPTVTPGDLVRVSGAVAEQFKATQISADGLTKLESGVALPPAVQVKLPLPVSERERYEGMRIGTKGVVTNNFTLGRGASFDIADDRIFTYTQINRPSAQGLAAYQAAVAERVLRIDDSSRWQNPDPVIFARAGQPLSAGNTLRGGDRVVVTGVLTFGNDGWTGSGSEDVYRLQAASATVAGPARPKTPTGVGGRLRVGSMNVLNYFTTLDGPNTGCTPGGSSSDARGANNCDEFLRQRDKIVAAITKLDADVLGLLEIQNDFEKGSRSSIANLVSALNTATAPGTYAAINPGENVGTDAITVAMIYKPASVTPVGHLAVLDNGFDPSYQDNRNRPTLAHTFQSKANGGRVTAVVAHLKSKGSACAGDPDLNDGQGNCNLTRTNAAQLIARWLGTNPTGVQEEDRLLLGDFNAYRMEDPLQALERAGYINLFDSSSYSYQFDGQWGSLDHALASTSLERQVVGETKWHINADEPTVLDYNTEFKSAAQLANFYAADPYRSSDHDPVLVGLNLRAQTPLPASAPIVRLNLSPDTAALTATVGGNPVRQSFVANGVNVPDALTVSVTPREGAPALATAPTTATSGEPFAVAVSAPQGTAPGIYTYEVKTMAGQASDTSILTVTVQAPPAPGTADLYFSEYVEGSSNNKALEIYNPTAQAVDLSAYSVELYSNGSATAGNKAVLSGSLAAGGTLVLVNSQASAALKERGQMTSAVTNFNGDDALLLKKNGEVIDSFGQVGFDPGTQWGTSPTATLDSTLRRKASVTTGDRNGLDAFDPAAEWDGFPQDTFDGLGTR